MSYEYENEKEALLTDEGQRMFLKVRDWAHAALKSCGAFRMDKATAAAGSGDSFQMMACVDRMVELGEVVEVPQDTWGQFRVFTEAR